MVRRLRRRSRQRDVLDRLHSSLTAAQEQRPRRRQLQGAGDGMGEPGWVAYERAVMHAEVNQARAELGAAPVALEAVARAERLAVGHIDYAAKFALHCSELVLSGDQS